MDHSAIRTDPSILPKEMNQLYQDQDLPKLKSQWQEIQIITFYSTKENW